MAVWVRKGEQHEGGIPRERETASGVICIHILFYGAGDFMGFTYVKTYQILYLK